MEKTITDDQGNKYELVPIFDHDTQTFGYMLEPMDVDDGWDALADKEV